MNITAYDHTSFTVPDLDKGVTFWRDIMRFRVDDVSDRTQPWLGQVVGVPDASCRIAHLFGYGLHLELIEYIDPVDDQGNVLFGPANRPGSAHMAFLVDEIHPFVNHMLAGGASTVGEIALCDGGHADSCHAVYLADPNGIIVELVEDTPG